MHHSHKIALALSACAGLAAAPVEAGSIAGQLNAQMTLQSACIVSGAPGAGTTGLNFGALDFGTQPSTFSGILVATASGGVGGAGPTQVVCSPDITSLSVSVSGGNNAGQGGLVGVGGRAMNLGSTSFMPYEIYSDAAHTTVFPTSAAAISVALPGSGAAIALPIFGRINKTNPAAMSAGTYSDVLQVTLTW